MPIKIVKDEKIYILAMIPQTYKELVALIIKQVFENNQEISFQMYYIDQENDQIELQEESDFQSFQTIELVDTKKSSKIYLKNIHTVIQEKSDDLQKIKNTIIFSIEKDQLCENQENKIEQKNSIMVNDEKFNNRDQTEGNNNEEILSQCLQIQQIQQQNDQSISQDQQNGYDEIIQQKGIVIDEQNSLFLSNNNIINQCDIQQNKIIEEIQIIEQDKICNNNGNELSINQNFDDQISIQSDQNQKVDKTFLNQELSLHRQKIDEQQQLLLKEYFMEFQTQQENNLQVKMQEKIKEMIPEICKIIKQDQNSEKIETNQGKQIHKHVQCDQCGMNPIVGIRYKCLVQQDYDICEICESQGTYENPLIKIRTPQIAQKLNTREIDINLTQNNQKSEFTIINQGKYYIIIDNIQQQKTQKQNCYQKNENKDQKKTDKEQKAAQKIQNKQKKQQLKVFINDLYGFVPVNLRILKKVDQNFDIEKIMDYLMDNPDVLASLKQK